MSVLTCLPFGQSTRTQILTCLELRGQLEPKIEPSLSQKHTHTDNTGPMQASLRWIRAPRVSEGQCPLRVSADAHVCPDLSDLPDSQQSHGGFTCRPIGLEEDPAGFASEAGQSWMCSAELRVLAEVNALGISGTE